MTRRTRKFAVLHLRDKLLVIEAAFTLALFRLALWALPARVFLNRNSNGSGRKCSGLGAPRAAAPVSETARLAWAIQATAPAIPKCTCLVRALAGRRLFARRGIATAICIGVAKSPSFQAHAWVEQNGTPVLNDPGQGSYVPLPVRL